MFCCCWYSFYQGDWQNVLERVKIQSRPADMPFFFDENIYLYNIGRPCMCVFFRSNFNIITAFDETQMWRTNYYCYHLLSVSMFDVSLHLFIRWTIKFIIQYIITIMHWIYWHICYYKTWKWSMIYSKCYHSRSRIKLKGLRAYRRKPKPMDDRYIWKEPVYAVMSN